MNRKKTDPYAVFLGVASLLLVVEMFFTWKQYKEMDAMQKRMARAKEWWKKSIKLEEEISKYPQKESAATVWTMQDVEDAINGAQNPKVIGVGVRVALKSSYHLNINFGAPRQGDVLDAWSYTSRPITVTEARVEDLGRFISAIECLVPQVKTTLIHFARPAEKEQGNGTIELTIYTEKEK